MLFAIAIGAAIWIIVPAVAHSLGWLRLRHRTVSDPRRAEPAADDPDYERRYRQFAALGFQPIGWSRESCWFINGHKWYWRGRGTRWMGLPDGTIFVTFHRMLDDEPVRFGAITIFERGGMVRTTCPGAGATIDNETCLRVEFPSIEPDELIAKHKEHVAAFSRRRGRTARPARIEDVAGEEEAQTNKLLTGQVRSSYGRPIVFVALPALIASRVGALPGSAWRRAAIGVCVGAAFAAVSHFILDPLARRKRLALARSAKAVARRPAPGNLDRDMRARFAYAKDLMRDGRHDEATEHLAWLWKNMTRVDATMHGARLSYLVTEIGTLVREHPPARERFRALRDETAAAADANPGLHDPRRDWVCLNEALADDDSTLAWFDAVKADPLSELVFGAVADNLVEILKRRNRWADIGRLHSDPLATLDQLQQMRAALEMPQLKARLGAAAYDQLKSTIAAKQRRDLGDLHAGLRAAGRDGEADALKARALSLDPSDDMKRALAQGPSRAAD
jgi:hypothetical protein